MVSEIEENSITEIAFAVVPRSGLTFIEQLQISSSKPCTKENQIHLIGVNQNEKVALLSKASCKCWNCEPCAARNAKRWIATVIHGVNTIQGNWYFLTITAHRKFRKTKSVDNLRKGWKKLYNRILVVLGETLQIGYYCKVWEQHEDGSFHVHILCNYCLGERWAKDNAAQCGMGFQANWSLVENAGQIAGYMAKYTLKNALISRGGVVWPKGLRRIETSRNWPKLPKLEVNLGWDWNICESREYQSEIAGKLQTEGYQLIDLT